MGMHLDEFPLLWSVARKDLYNVSAPVLRSIAVISVGAATYWSFWRAKDTSERVAIVLPVDDAESKLHQSI